MPRIRITTEFEARDAFPADEQGIENAGLLINEAKCRCLVKAIEAKERGKKLLTLVLEEDTRVWEEIRKNLLIEIIK
jgi:hypothetical protein